MTDEELEEIGKYVSSDAFPTSSPYSGDPYKARKMMIALLEEVKRLKRLNDEDN